MRRLREGLCKSRLACAQRHVEWKDMEKWKNMEKSQAVTSSKIVCARKMAVDQYGYAHESTAEGPWAASSTPRQLREILH